MPNHRTRAGLIVTVVLLALAAGPLAGTASGGTDATPTPTPAGGPSRLATTVADGGHARAIVTFTDPAAAPRAVLDAAGVQSGELFPTAGSAAVTVDARGLAALQADPRVAAVSPDFELQPLLTQTIPQVRADKAWVDGNDGAGRFVAVIDSGISPHPMFTRDIVREACFTSDASCPGGRKAAFGQGAALQCRLFECSHGLHVAGIAAGNAVAEQVPGGVARGARIIAIRVFRLVNRNGSPEMSAASSDVFRALEHVAALARTAPYRNRIAAVNLSLGFVVDNRGFSIPCDGDARIEGLAPVLRTFNQLFRALREQGIAVVAASGNEFLTRGVAAPACLSRALSVGAVDEHDTVPPFSNTAPGLSLLAPGATSVCSGGACGIKSAVAVRWGSWYRAVGTSAAAPHVAGTFAVMRQVGPSRSLDELETALQRSGQPVRDQRTGNVTPRLDVRGAANALRQFDRVALDQPATAGPRVGDFDGDGFDDIFWHDPSGATGGSIWLGAADRTFTPVVTTLPTLAGARVWVADVDGDGFDDIWADMPAPAGDDPHLDTVVYGAADLTTPATATYAHIGRVLAVGDFLGDDMDDLYVQDAGAGHDTIVEVAADRSGTTATQSSRSSAASIATFVGDFDANGADDLVRPGDREVWFSKGTGEFIVRTGLPEATQTAVADLNGDGRDDIVAVNARGNGEIWYFKARRIPVPVVFREARAFAVFSGNFDSSGGEDVFFYRPGTVADDQWYGALDRTRWTMQYDANPVALPVVGDYDGDGTDDIVWYGVGATPDSAVFGIALDE